MLLKAALLALAAPVAAGRELMPAQRHLLTTSDADILAATPTLVDFCTWLNTYTRAEHPGVIRRLGDDPVEYAADYISDGGKDLFDGGQALNLVFKKGDVTTGPLEYTRQKGPKTGALVTGSTGGGLEWDYAQIYHKNVFAGLYKSTAGGNFDKFQVSGEMGTTADHGYKGAGAGTFNSVAYEYFWIARKQDSDQGKFEIIVINSADGGKHCLNEYCYGSDYDYHRVIDTTDGFDKAGYAMFGMTQDNLVSLPWLDDGEGDAFAATVFRYVAGTMQNVL